MEAPRGRRAAPSSDRPSSVTSTTANPTPFTTKDGTTPTRAIRRPATAGPTIRAALKEAELSATAFTRSFRPTRLITKDCRAGASIVWARPVTSESSAICQ
jgi:hypothetical protein